MIVPLGLTINSSLFFLKGNMDPYQLFQGNEIPPSHRQAAEKASVLRYLYRYLWSSRTFRINTLVLWGMAAFLPLILRSFQTGLVLPFGFAITSMNTPLGTALSSDPDLEARLRTLPGQVRGFCLPFAVILFSAHLVSCLTYLLSWQLLLGGACVWHMALAVAFAREIAALGVLLEWRWPLRGWRVESDLWHHPRKYLVPGLLMLEAALLMSLGALG